MEVFVYRAAVALCQAVHRAAYMQLLKVIIRTERGWINGDGCSFVRQSTRAQLPTVGRGGVAAGTGEKGVNDSELHRRVVVAVAVGAVVASFQAIRRSFS